MQLSPNQIDNPSVRTVRRRIVEDVANIERKLLVPGLARPREVLVPVEETDPKFSHDSTDVYSEQTFNDINMDDIGQESALEPLLSRRLFIAMAILFALAACITTFVISFIDLQQVKDAMIKRLY
jgi:hypothetical protein